MSTLGTDFLYQCRINYSKNISPCDIASFSKPEYQALIEIAKQYFENNRESEFILFFQEYQYCVDLWAAHLVLKHMIPDDQIRKEALEIIKKYSKTTLNDKLANEEAEWLKEFEFKNSNL